MTNGGRTFSKRGRELLTRLGVLLLAISFGTRSCNTARGEADPFEARHYRVFSDRNDSREVAQLLESLHDRLDAFFNEAPVADRGQVPLDSPKVTVRLFDEREDYLHAMEKDGIDTSELDGTGGFCPLAPRCFYIYHSSDEGYRRYLILHEAVHRYVLDRFGENFSARDDWFLEGVADAFAVHRRIAEGAIAWGTPPSIGRPDFPTRFLSGVNHRKLPRSASGEIEVDRIFLASSLDDLDRHAVVWALVRKLIEDHADSFWKIWNAVLEGESGTAAWHNLPFAEKPSLETLVQWAKKRRGCWAIVWDSFEELRCDRKSPPSWGTFRASSETSALALWNAHAFPLRIELEPTPPKVSFTGGIVFGTPDQLPGMFELLLFDSEARDCRWYRREDRTWKLRHRWEFDAMAKEEPASEGCVFRIENSSKATNIYLQERHLLNLPREKFRKFGVFLERSSIRFSWSLLPENSDP